LSSLSQKTDSNLTGKLASIGFTLLLCDILQPMPTAWREKININVDRFLDRGGPGHMLNISPPNPGYHGGPLILVHPQAMATYLEATAILEVYGKGVFRYHPLEPT